MKLRKHKRDKLGKRRWDMLIEDYKQGDNLNTLSKKFNVSRVSIYRHFYKYGIREKPNQNKKPLTFWQRIFYRRN